MDNGWDGVTAFIVCIPRGYFHQLKRNNTCVKIMF